MEKSYLENLVLKNYSIYNIAKISKCSYTNIRYWLKKYNLKTSYVNSLSSNLTDCKQCTKCKEFKDTTNFYVRKNQRGFSHFCKKCIILDALKRQKEFKEQCLNYKGNKCIICNYSSCTSALEFHHLNPSEKEFCISESRSTKFSESTMKELDKCILVCCRCHRELHAGFIDYKCP